MPGDAPSTMALLFAGAAGFLWLRWRERKATLKSAVGALTTNRAAARLHVDSDADNDARISEHTVLVGGTI